MAKRSVILGTVRSFESEDEPWNWMNWREWSIGSALQCFLEMCTQEKNTVLIKLWVMRDCLAKRLSCVHGQERSCMKRTCKTSKIAFQKLGLDGCLREAQVQLDQSKQLYLVWANIYSKLGIHFGFQIFKGSKARKRSRFHLCRGLISRFDWRAVGQGKFFSLHNTIVVYPSPSLCLLVLPLASMPIS